MGLRSLRLMTFLGLKDEDIELGNMSLDKEISTDSSDENKEPVSE